MLLGLLALVRAAVELAEAEVAVGDEGAHAERLGATAWRYWASHLSASNRSVWIVTSPSKFRA
jgi:hypothetical protein